MRSIIAAIVVSIVAIIVIASLTGCCGSPYRHYQNAYGFNCPRPERYLCDPAPPKATPTGPTTPAIIPINSKGYQ